jgi:hypothetical protein
VDEEIREKIPGAVSQTCIDLLAGHPNPTGSEEPDPDNGPRRWGPEAFGFDGQLTRCLGFDLRQPRNGVASACGQDAQQLDGLGRIQQVKSAPATSEPQRLETHS